MRGLAVLVCLFHLANVSLSHADTSGISTQFPFSSTLVIGTKAANGFYAMQFAAFRSSTGGSPVGNISHAGGVTIKKGAYSVTLDFGPDAFNGEPVWVEARHQKLGTDTFVNSPTRIQIGSQPYSMLTARAAVADFATTAGFAAEALLASHATTADVALTATGAVPYSGTAFEVVKVTDNAVTNGQNLQAAYAVAKALTPNGQARSTTNRVAVLLPPAHYDIANTPLVLDTEFVDLIGLSSNRDNQFIDGTLVGGMTNTGILRQTANDVHIENIAADCSRSPFNNAADSTDLAAYCPNSGLTATVLRNCRFRSDNSHGWSTRVGIDYAGYYENCTGEALAFGGLGAASGSFINCTGGPYSFAGEGTASGTFKNCTGGEYAFGGTQFGIPGGTASGNFTACTGGDYSLGGSQFGNSTGNASGNFTACTGGTSAFGGTGVASGLFKDCTGGIYSFCGTSGTAAGGRFYHCVGGSQSFTNVGTPIKLFCIRNNVAVP